MNSYEDYESAAKLHLKYINKGFLPSLGLSFLVLLYEAIDKNEKSVLIIKKINGKVVGFVSGSEGMKPIYLQLILNRLPSLVWALLPALFSITKVYKILEILLISSKSKLPSSLPHQELLTIVVDPDYQGMGHADELFNSLCSYFSKANVKGFRIVVGETLFRAHAFYKKLGSKVVGEIEVHKGINSIVYLKKI